MIFKKLLRTSMRCLAIFLLLFAVTLIGMHPDYAWADKKNNSVIVGMTTEPSQFNPLLIGDPTFEGTPGSCMFDVLWDIRPDGNWYPNLAVEVPTYENGGISQDGLTWKIELKKGVKWQDGAPFTAADVEFTYQQIMNPKTMVRLRTGFDQITEFNVIDDYNIEFKLSKPFAPMYWIWMLYPIVPKHVLSKVPDINTCEWNVNGTFGTGPYKMVERVPGSHIIFKRNLEYHMGAPKIETIILKFIPDQTVMYTQLKTGEIDLLGPAGISAVRYEEAKKLQGVDILVTPSIVNEFLLFNSNKPLFQDKRVRQAIHMAIDKKKIFKDIYYDLVKPSLSYLGPDHWAYNHNLKQPYNPAKAAEMLDSLGWKKGPDGIREKDGKKMSFDFTCTVGNKEREQMQLLVQKNLREIGISANIKNLPPAVMWGSFFEETEYDLIIIGGAPDLAADPDFSASMHSKRPRWHYHPGTPEMDELLEKGLITLDREKRKKIYERFQELFLDETAYIPLFTSADIFAKKKGLKGYEINPYYNDITRYIREWYWE